jgi:hypothetical protein
LLFGVVAVVGDTVVMRFPSGREGHAEVVAVFGQDQPIAVVGEGDPPFGVG